MANYNVQITRGLRFSVKKRRDDWIENFGGGGGGLGGTVKRRVRFRFP